jgi:hypothetical protein
MGPAGPSAGYALAGASSSPSAGTAVVSPLALPAGNYLVAAKLWMKNDQLDNDDLEVSRVHHVACSLVAALATAPETIVASDTVRTAVLQGIAATGLEGSGSAALQLAHTFAEPAVVTLRCSRLDTNVGLTTFLDIKLSAVKVGELNP